MWYGLVNPATGDLASVGTEAMFAGGAPPPAGQQYTSGDASFDVIEFGATAPDWATLVWEAATRSVKPRPAPVLISRLDDVEAWLLADPDFAAAWAAMNATRKAQIRNGWRRVLARLIGGQQWRQEDEQVEI
jgi:hypothetical protein